MGFGDFLFGSEGTPGEHGIDVAYIDDYGDYAGMRQQMGDYYSGIMQGEEPAWMKNYLPGIEQAQNQALDRAYLGEGNNMSNSAMSLAGASGAATGVGPKATMAYQGKVGQDLAAKKAEAKMQMDQLRANWMGNNSMAAAQGMNAMPQGQRYSAQGYNIQPGAGSEGFLSKAAGMAMSSMMPGMGGMGGLGGMMGGGGAGGGGGGFMSGGNNPGTFGWFNQNTSSNRGGNLGYENTSSWTSPSSKSQYGGYDLGFDTSQYSNKMSYTGGGAGPAI